MSDVWDKHTLEEVTIKNIKYNLGKFVVDHYTEIFLSRRMCNKIYHKT